MRLAALLLLAACTKAPRAESRGTADAAPAATQPASDAAPDCFAQCMRDSQARAVSIDQIERDCRAQCSAAPPAP